MLDLKALNVFLTVADLVNMTAAAQRFGLSQSDSLVAMVAAGIGWALITPLCLLQARANPESVAIVPVRGAGFARELTLMSRRGEYGDLPRTIATSAGEIFRTQWQPELGWLAPWLAEAVTIG